MNFPDKDFFLVNSDILKFFFYKHYMSHKIFFSLFTDHPYGKPLEYKLTEPNPILSNYHLHKYHHVITGSLQDKGLSQYHPFMSATSAHTKWVARSCRLDTEMLESEQRKLTKIKTCHTRTDSNTYICIIWKGEG